MAPPVAANPKKQIPFIRNDVEGGDKTGDLADEAEVFECFHGARDTVSTFSLPQPAAAAYCRCMYELPVLCIVLWPFERAN